MAAKKTKNSFKEFFSTLNHLPFLFIGSGVSLRYLNLPNWEELLRMFALKIHPSNPVALEVYRHRAGGDNWPQVATLIEDDFNQIWLTAPEYESQRKLHQGSVKAKVSPFKIELAAYFQKAQRRIKDPQLLDELSILTNVAKRSVAGVITTNYDLLLEDIFKGYEVFIGQEQLLFGGTQGVGEIYKIHGCCTRAESIVINAADYADFDRRNAYLAAKLLTVFVDHPIIFLGYSVSDPNIQAILAAIVACLSEGNLNVLKQRLIFVEYNPDPAAELEFTERSLLFHGGARELKMTKISLHDFLPLFSELQAQKYQYNPKLLRQIKRDIYRLVTTNEPVDRFKIQDIEDDEGLESVEVLAGIGVIPEDFKSSGGERGHHIPEACEIFCDVVFDDRNFDLRSLVEDALPKLQRTLSHTLPIHKYVRAYRKQFKKEPPTALLTDCKESVLDFLNQGLKKSRRATPIHSLEELSELAITREKWFTLLPRLTPLEDSVEAIGEYLASYLTDCPEVLREPNKTDIKRVIRIYDWLKYK